MKGPLSAGPGVLETRVRVQTRDVVGHQLTLLATWHCPDRRARISLFKHSLALMSTTPTDCTDLTDYYDEVEQNQTTCLSCARQIQDPIHGHSMYFLTFLVCLHEWRLANDRLTSNSHIISIDVEVY